MKGNKGFEYCSTWQLRSGWVFAEGPKSKKPLKRIESFSNALYLSWLSWVEEFWVEMKGSCVQEMGEKRCFWIFNWWEQVDENEGSSDGERTFPFPSSFHPFFPYGGKIVQQIHQTYLPFVKERRKQKRELREAAAADLEVGSWVMAVPYVYSKHGVRRFFIRLSCRW